MIGDEAWDVDYFLHENPELKRFAFAWMTDFVGLAADARRRRREAALTADYNAEMLEQRARYRRLRDRSIFVGHPDDIVAGSFGAGLPEIRGLDRARTSTSRGTSPADTADRGGPDPAAGRVRLPRGRADLPGLGRRLRGRRGHCSAACSTPCRWPAGGRPSCASSSSPVPGSTPIAAEPARRRGARLPRRLVDHLAACDVAIVQGGLSTCMELTAAARPFLYVPLRHHFEQNFHVRADWSATAPARASTTSGPRDPDALVAACWVCSRCR